MREPRCSWRCCSTSRWAVLLVLAFLAGLATPPFEAARSAALPDLVPEEGYRDALALSGISVQSSLVIGYALGGLLLTVVEPTTAIAINAMSFLVSAFLLLDLRHSEAARPAATRSTVSRSLGDGAASLFGDPMVRRALGVRRRSRVRSAPSMKRSSSPTPISSGYPTGSSASSPPRSRSAPWSATAIIAGGRRDHHSLLRTAGWCGAITSAAAAPLFWFEASGALAFVAFAISGGMFAVSIPTNTVIGLRLSRDTRASAMGIAVGVLMGSQALGAAVGGIVASAVGPPRAIGGALALAAVYSLWAVTTTPIEAKHLAVHRRPVASLEPVAPVEPVVRTGACAGSPRRHGRRPRGDGGGGGACGRAPVNQRAGPCVSPVMPSSTRALRLSAAADRGPAPGGHRRLRIGRLLGRRHG